MICPEFESGVVVQMYYISKGEGVLVNEKDVLGPIKFCRLVTCQSK